MIHRGDRELTTDLSHQSGHYFAHRVAKAQNSSCRPAFGPTRAVCVKKLLLHTFKAKPDAKKCRKAVVVDSLTSVNAISVAATKLYTYKVCVQMLLKHYERVHTTMLHKIIQVSELAVKGMNIFQNKISLQQILLQRGHRNPATSSACPDGLGMYLTCARFAGDILSLF